MLIVIIFIVVILISALISFLRGAIREILTIFSVTGALAAAYFFGASLTPMMEHLIGVDPSAESSKKFLKILPYDIAATALAYGSIFLIVVLILSLASHLISETAKAVGLGAIDRSAGVVFGLIRGGVILGLINLPIHIHAHTPDTRPEFLNTAINKSSTYFYIDQTSKFLKTFVPKNENTAPIVKKAKEKIQIIDIPNTKEIVTKTILNTPTSASKENSNKGYNEEFRDKMDQLFEQEQ